MLTFREGLRDNDPQVIREIAASTGFFDKQDIANNFNIAQNWVQTKHEHRSEDCDFLLAEYEGQTVAYACFGKIPNSDSSYELYWLSTDNRYRGCGIGRLLMQRLLEKVRELGGCKLFVKTDGTEQYMPTRRFYESCGFRPEACLKEYYNDRDDCWIYSYKLPSVAVQSYNTLAAE